MFFKTNEEYEKMYEAIKGTIEKNTNIDEDDSVKRKVLIFGPPGSGKSTLADILASKRLIIDSLGDDAIVNGEGVDVGSESVTSIPRLLTIENYDVCDLPGFKDTRGIPQEIVNAYLINKLLQNNNCPKKIIICFNSHDVYGRREEIEESIKMLDEMFPDHDQLKMCTGLVFSMNDDKHSAKGYLTRLKKKSSEALSEWCDFFLSQLENNRVFLFPSPSMNDKGKEYKDFPDRPKLIEFLNNQNFDIADLQHNIGLSDVAKKSLEIFGYQVSFHILEEVDKFFKNIKTDLNNNKNSIDSLRNYTNLVNNIREGPHDTVDNLSQMVQNAGLNFRFDFQKLNDLDRLNNFVGQQLKNDDFNHSVIKLVKYKIGDLIDDLKILFENIISSESAEENIISSDYEEIEETLTTIREDINRNKDNNTFWPTFIGIVTAGATVVGGIALAFAKH